MVTWPAPYSPAGMVPLNDPYSMGWSSTRTARWFWSGETGRPLGRAHDASTPSCSNRKSQWRLEAWCSWMTKVGPVTRRDRAGRFFGTGSGVRSGSRLRR